MTSALRPRNTPGLSLRFLADTIAVGSGGGGTALPDVRVSGVTLRAQDAVPGDLFAALPGSTAHGAEFAAAAIAAGAVAVLTDADGVAVIHRLLGDPAPVPVLVHPAPRAVLGALAVGRLRPPVGPGRGPRRHRNLRQDHHHPPHRGRPAGGRTHPRA